MLFTTLTFILLFLPLTLSGYFLFGRLSPQIAATWLFAASLFFYGYWMPEFTLLLVASIAINFALGVQIARSRAADSKLAGFAKAKVLLTAGVGFNLGLLGWFKYANFLVGNFNAILGTDLSLGQIILPIGISFYSFTQIAFLVDTAAGKVKEFRPVHYGLFVTYFPHLIAGPVLHHAQMMPQFSEPTVYRFQSENFVAGMTIFGIGLFKKIVLADGVAPYADAVFGPADTGQMPSTGEAWLGAMAYTLQLYFDFSGYSDMAVGLSWMFNVRLPFNFDSPYKALSISDFWRRWHITLSTFLRDYLYIALGGNRKGPTRRYLNLAMTMVLGGLWHGASWSFVLWGALHGMYLMLNHGFRALCERTSVAPRLARSRTFVVAAWALTLLCVIVAWVFFRAHTLDGALRILTSMACGGAPLDTDTPVLLWNAGLKSWVGWGWCCLLGLCVTLMPNSNTLGSSLLERCRRWPVLRIVAGTVGALAVLALALVNATRDSVSAFIYFNF